MTPDRPTFGSTTWSIIGATSDYHDMTGGADDTTVLYVSGWIDLTTPALLEVRQAQIAAGHDLVLRHPSDPVITIEHRDDPTT